MYLGPVDDAAGDVEGEHDGAGTDGGYLGVRTVVGNGISAFLWVEFVMYLLPLVIVLKFSKQKNEWLDNDIQPACSSRNLLILSSSQSLALNRLFC